MGLDMYVNKIELNKEYIDDISKLLDGNKLDENKYVKEVINKLGVKRYRKDLINEIDFQIKDIIVFMEDCLNLDFSRFWLGQSYDFLNKDKSNFKDENSRKKFIDKNKRELESLKELKYLVNKLSDGKLIDYNFESLYYKINKESPLYKYKAMLFEECDCECESGCDNEDDEDEYCECGYEEEFYWRKNYDLNVLFALSFGVDYIENLTHYLITKDSLDVLIELLENLDDDIIEDEDINKLKGLDLENNYYSYNIWY